MSLREKARAALERARWLLPGTLLSGVPPCYRPVPEAADRLNREAGAPPAATSPSTRTRDPAAPLPAGVRREPAPLDPTHDARVEVVWPGAWMDVRHPGYVEATFPEVRDMKAAFPSSEPTAFWWRVR